MKLNKKYRILIAADGGAGSGKTTGSKMLAKKYNLRLLSSGLLYRLYAYRLLKRKKTKSLDQALKRITKKISSKNLKNKNLYKPEITEYSAKISKIKKIRSLLRNYQRNFAKNPHSIIEGRDIGTVIIPNADLKLFFKCSLNVKARRRFKEYRKSNKKISFNDVKNSIKLRDLSDTKRKISPLRPAKGAVIVDTTRKNKGQVLSMLSRIVEKKIKEKYGRNL